MFANTHKTIPTVAALCLAAICAPGGVFAQISPHIEASEASKLYPGKTYSPYAQRAFPSDVYWGETHLHTGYSLDAGLFGNTLTPEDAYRFARGEEIKSSTGLPVKLGRPLDFLVVADHSDAMGLALDIKKGTPNIVADPTGKRWHEAFVQGGQAAGKAAFELIQAFAQFELPEQMLVDYSPGSAPYSSVWENIIDAAEKYNEPGRFTAIIGYEWTSVPQGNNLHRNVILRDGGNRARQVLPLTGRPWPSPTTAIFPTAGCSRWTSVIPAAGWTRNMPLCAPGGNRCTRSRR
jgi:hypothetical protein